MKRFVIFYIHRDYGRYSTILEDIGGIEETLAYFRKHYANGHTAYGIMELN